MRLIGIHFMAHKTNIRVRGYHLDGYQHVNNARYLEFLEEARWNYLEQAGDTDYFHSRGIAWVIVNININYRMPADTRHVLAIYSQFTKVGQKSAVIHQEIFIEGTDTKVADADITFVCLNQKTGLPIALEGDIRERLTRHLEPSAA